MKRHNWLKKHTLGLAAALLFGLWALGAVMPAALAVVMGIALLMYVASVPCISAS